MGWTDYTLSTAGFIVDGHSVDRDTGRQIDWANVPDSFKGGTTYTVTKNGAATEGDAAIVVDALPVAIPAGTVLDFGEHSVDSVQMLAKTTADAASGATNITTEPLGHAIEDDATATYVSAATRDDKFIPAGTIMAEMASGKVVPRSDRPGSETSVGLLATNADQGAEYNAKTGFGLLIGGVFYDNLIPDADDGSLSTYKTELASAGTGFSWRTYADSRAS